MELGSKGFCQWIHLLHAVLKLWTENLKQFPVKTDILLFTNHHITRKTTMLTLEKLTAKETHMILSTTLSCKPSSKIYFDNLMKNSTKLEIKLVYYPVC